MTDKNNKELLLAHKDTLQSFYDQQMFESMFWLDLHKDKKTRAFVDQTMELEKKRHSTWSFDSMVAEIVANRFLIKSLEKSLREYEGILENNDLL